MTANVKIGIAVAAVVVVAVALGFFYLSGSSDDGPPVEPVVSQAELPEPTRTPTLAEQLSLRLQGVTLATSDAAIRELVSELSSRPALASWLVNEDLVRRFTATVDNIADGRSPRAHLEFLGPKKGFKARGSEGEITINPSSYARYDIVADVITSLDAEGTVLLYRELRPLVREAYREIAPPGADFDERLVAAIDHLLATPDVSNQPRLKLKVVTYTYADPALENLSSAQRHLLRTGPDNARSIKTKLAELKAALLSPGAEQVIEAE